MQNNNGLYFEILDKKRLDTLPLLANFKDTFYLAGGTSLALQLGHRDSIDFDFFTKENFDENKLIEKLEQIFGKTNINIIQIERGTITAIIYEEVKVSFFNYKYDLIDDLIESEYLSLASVRDIACMKLSAICSRSVNKDYIDLYFILKSFNLEDLLSDVTIKYPVIDISVILKSLVYFDDIEEEPMIMVLEKDLKMDNVKKFIVEKVKEYTVSKI